MSEEADLRLTRAKHTLDAAMEETFAAVSQCLSEASGNNANRVLTHWLTLCVSESFGEDERSQTYTHFSSGTEMPIWQKLGLLETFKHFLLSDD